jgi:multicomponent Na+:H+ antiporter subunit F
MRELGTGARLLEPCPSHARRLLNLWHDAALRSHGRGVFFQMLPIWMSGLALFLMLTLAAGLVRMVRGPNPADRMVAMQLFGSTVVAILLLLAEVTDRDPLRNVALAFVLLSLLALIAFVERTPPGKKGFEG